VSATLIDLIRHGEPVGGRRYRGCGVDDPLSETGWQQMRHAVGDAAPWTRVLSSPLQRCQAFARELAEHHRLPLEIVPEFAEVGMGAWEGRAHHEIAVSEPERHRAYRNDPVGCRPEGAEPLEAFLDRVVSAYRARLERHPGEHLLIVCHSGTTRAILGEVLGLGPHDWYRTKTDYAGITRIRHGANGPVLECMNRPTLP